MDVSVRAEVKRLATSANPNLHTFPGGVSTVTQTESGRAQGLGDILLRGKYRFFDAAGGGLAAGLDVRLPTGDAEQLLGAGGTQGKLSFIGSMAAGVFSPHFNIGYTFSGGQESSPLAVTPQRPDEFSYAAGFDMALTNRVTMSADVLGRSLRDLGRLVPVSRQFPFTTSTGSFGLGSFEEFARRPGDLSFVVGAAGFRYNPRGNLLISAQLLVPMTDGGLKDKFTPVVGLDYSF
jgi:hypothetical protein